MTVVFDKHTRIVGPDAEQLGAEMARLYSSGMSIRELADEYGRSYGAVQAMLIEAGADLRSRGGAAGRQLRNKARGAKGLNAEQVREYQARLFGY